MIKFRQVIFLVALGLLGLLVACAGANSAPSLSSAGAAPVASSTALSPLNTNYLQVTGVPTTTGGISLLPSPTPSGSSSATQWLTLPPGFPALSITAPAQNTGDGDIFLSNWTWPVTTSYTNTFLLILDNMGQPVYYQSMVPNFVTDFKKQPNGLLTFYDAPTYNAPSGYFAVMDSSYNIIDKYQVKNNYTTDLHDLQLLPNGHALLLGVDPRTVDMSKIVSGGEPKATVLGAVIQELDASKNVVFQWDSWDHFLITDTTESLTGPMVDPVHANSIQLDTDGNILLSSRHMDEITKINRQTGDIMWRLGGKHNQFKFTNDQPFIHQHDARRLPNGNLTLFDNRTNQNPAYSRAVEYQLDESAKTVTKIWEYRENPDAYTEAMGDVQRLSNGNTLIGWGSAAQPAVTEVRPDGTVAFKLVLGDGNVSYRAFRFPWQGSPTWDPALVARRDGITTTLAYSWNGATNIASYRLYGGDSSGATHLITTTTKTGFETQTILQNSPYCSFRVMPLDAQGHATRYSNEVRIGPNCQK